MLLSFSLSILLASIFLSDAPKTQIAVTPSGPLYVGSDITVICSADANPAVTQIRWFREWQGNVSEENRTETALTFQMSPENEGLYYCEAQNVYGKQNSSKVSLEITGINYSTSFEKRLFHFSSLLTW